MRKWWVLALALGSLLFPATVFAGIIFIPVTDVVYRDLGDTTGGELQITTTGLRGVGTLSCDGAAGCSSEELDGLSFGIRQRLQLVFSGAEGQGFTVAGRSRGGLRFPASAITLPDSARFRADVVGRARCAGVDPESCQTLQVRVRVRGPVVDGESGARIGGLNLIMMGTLTLPEDGIGAPAWTALTAEGTLGLSDNE